ncbi:class I SAM-dependent methyltransferase [Bosea sp. AS-1]|uniref:class I SAM-dependent methyltransferase n=1 Tax=Bosea sp. AS-1 TaxID=2015316 RepID=UPI000B782082|nr:class I SAM-dependent methyltransferase [Bosea sp. AS-1]
MNGEKVALHGAQETLLITLCAKAGESRLPDSLLKDRFAAEALARIDYDFDRLKIDRDMMIGIALRAHVIDGWTRGFLEQYPESTVLHLGCGLDSRVFRIAPFAGVRWFDVDYPDVIALRHRLYPAREGYTLLPSSVTEPEWLDAVPQDRPAFIIAEGLLPYLPPEEVVLLLERVTNHLPGGELAFDAYSRLGLTLIAWQPSVRATGATLHWSLDDPEELLRQLPGLELVEELMGYGSGGYDPAQVARMSLVARMAVPVMGMIPALSRIGRLLRFRF